MTQMTETGETIETPAIVAMLNQKGGVGKTTLTTLRRRSGQLASPSGSGRGRSFSALGGRWRAPSTWTRSPARYTLLRVL